MGLIMMKFSPVARFESLQTVIALSVINSFKMDVTTAFLKGELEEEVYIHETASWFHHQGPKGFVCKLKRSIYGLKQSQ